MRKAIAIVVIVLSATTIGLGYSFQTDRGGTQHFWSHYREPGLGLSFDHPSNFKITLPETNLVRIDSDYKNSAHQAVRISMLIERINTVRQSVEDLESLIKPNLTGDVPAEIRNELSKRQYVHERNHTYDIVRIVSGDFLSFVSGNRGTFRIDSSLNVENWKELLEKEGLYQHYRAIFEQILFSLRFE